MLYIIAFLLIVIIGSILYLGLQLETTNKKLNDIVHNTAIIGRRVK